MEEKDWINKLTTGIPFEMGKTELGRLISWFEIELKNGNRSKASRIYRVFCKMARKKYPKMKANDFKNYKKFMW